MHRQTVFAALFVALATAALADDHPQPSPVPKGYSLVWADEFKTLSLRTGGWTYQGLQSGSGTWSAPGAWYAHDPRGVEGYGWRWFVDPGWHGWPKTYQGPFAITTEGLRIRAEPPTQELANAVPRITVRYGDTGTVFGHGIVPWLAGQLNSFHAVRIEPPFYFEARARMPAGVGRPWPAIWLLTGGSRPFPNKNNDSLEYEIDVHEGFGDSGRLHATIHWNRKSDNREFPGLGVVDRPAGVDLSKGMNTWGCLVTEQMQVFYFNGHEVGRVTTPPDSNIKQPFGILLDVTAGLPWNGGGPPGNGPHDMIVEYVRLYAPDKSGLTLR